MKDNIRISKICFSSLIPYKKTIIIQILFPLIFLLTNMDFSVISGIIMLYTTTIVSYPFLQMDTSNLNILYGTLPVDRKNVVNGHYIFAFIVLGIALIYSLFFTFVSKGSSNTGENSYLINLLTLGIFMFMGLSLILIQIPLLFKYGYSKSRMIIMAPFLIIFIIIITFAGLLSANKYIAQNLIKFIGNIYLFFTSYKLLSISLFIFLGILLILGLSKLSISKSTKYYMEKDF